MQNAGALSKEQFALALWLIEEKTSKGIDPPSSLTPEMIPPSYRVGQPTVSKTGSVLLISLISFIFT